MKMTKKKTLTDIIKGKRKKYSKQKSLFDEDFLLIYPGSICDLTNKILESEEISEDLLGEISRSLGEMWMRRGKNHWDYLKKK